MVIVAILFLAKVVIVILWIVMSAEVNRITLETRFNPATCVFLLRAITWIADIIFRGHFVFNNLR